jgi:hypothetical protein
MLGAIIAMISAPTQLKRSQWWSSGTVVMFFHDVIIKLYLYCNYTCTIYSASKHLLPTIACVLTKQKAIYTVLGLVVKASCHIKSYGIMASSWRSVCVIGCYRVNYTTACTLYIHVRSLVVTVS